MSLDAEEAAVFVDTNVWILATGKPHTNRGAARAVLEKASADGRHLVTSSEVLQEVLHAFRFPRRTRRRRQTLALIAGLGVEVWKVDATDVLTAEHLAEDYPRLEARDLVHLACCQRRGVHTVATFDEAVAAAFPFHFTA